MDRSNTHPMKRHARRCLLLAALSSIASTSDASAQVALRVDAGAAPGGDGLSWASALGDLQSALDAAAPLADGGQVVQVWIKAGTYIPTLRTDPTNPVSATFALRDRVEILGGFAGDETLATQRDPAANVTTLSGLLDAVTLQRACYVVSGTGVGQAAVLDGVEIADARNGPGQSVSPGGGAVMLTNASPVVRNCVFRNNSTFGFADCAAAFYTESGSPVLLDCRFANNSASSGRGVIRAASGELRLERCEFNDNTGGGDGICAGIDNNAALTLRDCSFINSAASNSGAISSTGTIDAKGCLFDDCRGGNYAGAAKLWAGTNRFESCTFVRGRGAVDGKGEFVRCDFIQNGSAPWYTAPISGGGTFVSCRFLRNSSSYGGIVTGEGVFINCVFDGNQPGGSTGGTLRLTGNSLVSNCTIVNNNRGGIRHDGTGQLTVENTLLWNNTIYGAANEAAQINAPTNALVLNHNFIHGLTGALGGAGNLGGPDSPTPNLADLLGPDGLAGTGDEDLRPAPGSWCIDAADAGLIALDVFDLDGDGNVAEPIPFDVLGSPRVHDDAGIDNPAGRIADIGAMEFQGASCRADRDRDGAILPADVSLFVSQWFSSVIGGTPAGDYDHNGVVQPADVSGFVADWFAAATGPCPTP